MDGEVQGARWAGGRVWESSAKVRGEKQSERGVCLRKNRTLEEKTGRGVFHGDVVG